MIQAVNKPDETVIANMHLRGINRKNFEDMIYPTCGTQRRIKIMNTVDNAIIEMTKVKRIKATLDPAEGAERAPDGVAPEKEKISDLREALRTGSSHPQILNLRRVTPKVGQKVQTTCMTHNLYWSAPGTGEPLRITEAPYTDAAMLGRQHEVLDLREGPIGDAYYYAVQVDISTPQDKREGHQMLAYLNYRMRYFKWGGHGSTTTKNWSWTSDCNRNWWCETLVGDEYFSASDEDARKRPMWVNDRRNDRVIEGVLFKPVEHNPGAIREHKKLSKCAATRLRHGDGKDFINGVAMDIGSFVNYMTKQCAWVDETSDYQNRGRYRAREFDTEGYACQWDMEGIIHMLGVCSNYQRFSLMMART